MTECCASFRRYRPSTTLLFAFALAGCAINPNVHNATGAAADATAGIAKTAANVIGAPLIPDANVQLSATTAYPLEKLVYWGLWVGAAWLILDPLAPNWEIEEARLSEDHVHFSLKMKRIYSGGAGEARSVLDRRAKALVRAGGYQGYEIIEYAERLDSSVLGSQRMAEGVIRLIRKPS